MTAPDFAAMSAAELAAVAAGLMGWVECSDEHNAYYKDSAGAIKCFARDYDPCNDMTEAAEFGAAFLAAWPGYYFIISVAYLGCSAQVFENKTPGSVSVATHPSEARARTECICAAWTALSEGRG